MLPFLALAVASLQAGHTFGWDSHDFLLDGKRFEIRSGEMHAARVPRDYWRHRLQMVRAMGCNTVCAYLFWNQHEPEPGKWNFKGNADIAEYCRIAQQVGLKVILRPGPYSCAEWEFGGFPWWLLKTRDIKLRTRDPRYLAAVKRYLLRVGKELAPLQWSHGGPIIMVQVENEYGSYGKDKEYIGDVRDDLKEAGFDVPLFTCDGPSQLPNDTRPDIFSVVNFGGDPEESFAALRKIRPTGPLMCGEFYPGWFDAWGKPHSIGSTEETVRDLGKMLDMGASFSIYMVHGGTSFGYTAGANSPPFAPQTTSYDYDAPISEGGLPTPKYFALRELFSKHLLPRETLPDVPKANPVIAIPRFRLEESASFLSSLGRPVRTGARTFEELDHPYGCVLYRTTLPPGLGGSIADPGVHDIAYVSLDGKRIGVFDRRRGTDKIALPESSRPQTLDFLVEAMGRVNYGRDIHDRKGLPNLVLATRGDVSEMLGNWNAYPLPYEHDGLEKLRFRPGQSAGPSVYRGSVDLKATGDTYLDMHGWNKGMVWVNGHNLGRFWHIGPTQTMYLPGPWLKRGANEVLILDLGESVPDPSVQGLTNPVLDEVHPG